MLKQTLEQLSEDGKKVFLEKLVEKADNLDAETFDAAYQASLKVDVHLGVKYLLAKHQNETAVLLLENYKEYVCAAELCKKLGFKDRAVDNFLTAKETKKAVEVYLEVDGYRLETTEVVFGVGLVDHLDELEKYETEKNYSKAADKSKSLGMIKRAAKNLRLAGKEQEAEELLNSSDQVKAARVWEDKKKISEAVGILFNNEFYVEIAQMHERVGDFFSAGISYQGQNNLEKALECYKKAQYSPGVDRILMQLGRTDDLVTHWEETNNYLNLAEHYQDKNPVKAANFYLKLKEYKKSAESFISAGRTIEGMMLLSAKEYFEDALKIAEQETNKNAWLTDFLTSCYKGAAVQNEKSQPVKALEYFEKAGEREKVKTLALKLMKASENSGDFKNALIYSRKAEDKTAEELYASAVELLK